MINHPPEYPLRKRIWQRIILLLLMPLMPHPGVAQPLPDRPALLGEIGEKMNRVQRFLTEHKLGGLLLSRVNNVAWMTAGLGDSHILLTSETGPASLLILRDGRRYVVGPKTETDHLLAEGMGELGYQALAYNWYDSPRRMPELIAGVTNEQPVGSDTPMEGFRPVQDLFAPLRYQLTDSEAAKYRWVCRQASEAVAQVCRTIRPGMTEREIEALTAGELQRRGLQPTVVLIGVDDRLQRFYHYPPTDKKLERHAFVNVCARRWGLVTSVGRYVYFGAVPEEIRKNMQASAIVCARMLAATKAGAKAADLFRLAQRSYAELGYPDQWQRIHSGGAIGYAEREWVATETSTESVLPRQAFAWNPFTPAALSFDTVWLRADGSDTSDRLENLTALPDWPTLRVQAGGKTFQMPDLLVRPMP